MDRWAFSALRIRWARCARGFVSAGILLAMFTVLGNGQAHAYVDPGTGSLVLQTIIAVLAGMAATFAAWRARIAQIFQRRKNLKR